MNARAPILRTYRVGAGDSSRMHVGFGSTFPQLDSSDPAFHAAWLEVQSQLIPSDDVTAAQTAMANSYDQLVNLGVSDVVGGAKAFTLTTRTAAGAVGQVEGLIAAAAGGAPTSQLIQQVTGAIVAIGVVAGGASVGVGTVIMVAAATLISVLQNAGLFGSSSVADLCGTGLSRVPDWTIGCVAVNGQDPNTKGRVLTPSSSLWRSFPDPNGSGDAAWFAPGPGFSWEGAGFANAKPHERAIDAAFWPYQQINADTGAAVQFNSPTKEFQQAFFAAWKMNNEMQLNGLKPQSDYLVLKHVWSVWQRSHLATSTVAIDASAGTYLASLINAVASDPPEGWNGSPTSMVLNTGTKPHIISPLDPCVFTPNDPRCKPGVSTGTKVVGGVAAAALAAPALWALLHRQAVGYVYGRIFDRVKRVAKEAWRGVHA